MKYSVVLLLLLATANTAQTSKEAGGPNLVRRRDLGNGKRKKENQKEEVTEAMMELEALTVDVENLIEDVVQVEAELVEEAEMGEELAEARMKEAHARVGNKRDQAGNRGRHKDEKDAAGAETRGGSNRWQTRERDGEKTRGGRGDKKKHGHKKSKDGLKGSNRKKGRISAKAAKPNRRGGPMHDTEQMKKTHKRGRGGGGRGKEGRAGRAGKARK